MRFDKSEQWLERAKRVIPFPYNQTFSKGPAQFVQGMSPIFAVHGKGCYLYDVDSNRYIDLIMGLMPCVLGYVPIASKEMEGVPSPTLSLPHHNEVELSELLCEIIPCAEMVRFGKNGSDATSAAVRLARAITGRDKVLCCGYHGWQDWYVGTTWRNKGVPEAVERLTIPFVYNEVEAFELLVKAHNPACVIMEPVNFISPKAGFLEKIRKICDREGVILIFDEIITGFRWALGGAQEFFGVTPDLACFGKAMANGWPISAVVGKKEYMKEFGDVHFSTTFGGEILSIAASLATINYIRQNDVIDYLWNIGGILKSKVERLMGEHTMQDIIGIEGYDVWTRLKFRDVEVKSLFVQETIARGVLVQETHNLSYSHKLRHIQDVVSVYDEVFELIKGAVEEGTVKEKIKGIPIVAKQIRDQFGRDR